MEFTVAKRKVELKFDFKTMFKINNKLGTINKETGERNSDGVGSLFYKILERNEDAIVDLIKLSVGTGKKAVSEDEILDAIAEQVEVEGSTESLFKEIEEAMVESGFFKEKILKYIETMKKNGDIPQSERRRERDGNSSRRRYDWKNEQRTILVECAKLGLTDIDVIYKCSKFELDAIMEGLQYRQISERENLSELALNLRYTLNAKKVNVNKMKLDKQRNKIKRIYQSRNQENVETTSFAKRIEALNLHFQNLE